MLTTSQGGCRDYVKLNIWYKVLSTVLGIPDVLNKYEFLSLGTTLITVKTFNSSLLPLGKSPNSFTCHLRPSSPCLPSASLCVMTIPAPSLLAPHRERILPHGWASLSTPSLSSASRRPPSPEVCRRPS